MSETKPHAGQKKFQKNSKYAKYDVSGDGVVDDEELELVKEINELEAKEDILQPKPEQFF